MVDRLELFEVVADAAEPGASSPEDDVLSTHVFVVHGRHEQANEGRTILEKLEANTEDVGFAVVLLQADDYGRGPDEQDWPRLRRRF